MTMTPDAKRALAQAIRDLRGYLVGNPKAPEKQGTLGDAVDQAYRTSVRVRDAGLSEAARAKRARLEAFIEEQARGEASRGKKQRSRAELRREVEKQAAYTLLNRLVILRIMEATGLRGPEVVTGGWDSSAYKDFRQLAPALVRSDETEGYAFLLQLVFEDLAQDLPGLYGPAGVADLVPIPAPVLRHVIEALDDEALATCWTDDMTLGWVYQYWNDPEREALDDKLNAGGKVEPHEIASKTQMFTERYMVDWLLQNSLGPMWLAMCQKHGWVPEVEARGTLAALEERRVDWRKKRDAGEVALVDLMPLHSDEERHWAYYVPQPIPEDAVVHAPATVRDLKVLDPAVGSGHFLVVAFELLVALYREEARHRGEAGEPEWSERAIVERILEHNLHGIDLDPRAVQIAAAALWLKAQQTCKGAHPARLNLVASSLRLASLPDDDPALVELRREVERETGIPAALTDTIVHALKGADHLGSLLKVDRAVDEAIEAHERSVTARFGPQQVPMFGAAPPQQAAMDFEAGAARRSLVERLEAFLARHTGGEDLGLRLRGEQLAAGVRFARLVREGTYDLVVANPPYQGTSKMAESMYVEQQYALGKADLYAAFLLRALELVRAGGVSAMLTLRNWMFIKQYAAFRENVLRTQSLRAVGDLSWGAFREMRDNPVTMSVIARGHLGGVCTAIAPTNPQERTRTREEVAKKSAGLLCHAGRYDFDPAALEGVPESPLVYWWDEDFLRRYLDSRKLGEVAPCKVGLVTGNNIRFVRAHHEILPEAAVWASYVSGAQGAEWFEACDDRLNWRSHGLETKLLAEVLYGTHTRQVRNEDLYFRVGIACTAIGSSFAGRIHRRPSIVGSSAASVFPDQPERLLALLNSRTARFVLQSLNPGVHFEVGDINRLPVFSIGLADETFAVLEHAFGHHESHREASVEFKLPGPSPWRNVQEWAQVAVDRSEGAPLPEYVEELDPEPATDHLSFALGVALGRFSGNGEGVLEPHKDDLSHALPAGLLFLDGTLDDKEEGDSLGHPAAAALHDAWKAYGDSIGTSRTSLRQWLALDFFKDVHKGMYENRPIHWPLTSDKKTFVAWITIHRWDERTLRVLLADHLAPARTRLDGELTDLRAARDGADKKAARAAEKRFDKVKKQYHEIERFIAEVQRCAEKGPPPTDATCAPREIDARYAPDLDDGVMINSAALWPLLEPQWKDPKKWWKELANAQGKKDYDWSHLAMRYWPARVDAKCRQDPSLGVAHGCFWKYHPARAWAWELRLQDEIGPDFRIEEAPYRGDGGHAEHRKAYLRDHPQTALEAIEKEVLRRRRKQKTPQSSLRILEPGLWPAVPEQCWELELRVSSRQGAELRLLAPDEEGARAAFERAHPQKVQERERLLAELKPPPELFDHGGEGPGDDDGGDTGEAESETEEDGLDDEREEAEA